MAELDWRDMDDKDDQIRELEQQIERLREILTGIAKRHTGYEHGFGPCCCEWHRKARAALGGQWRSRDG